MAMAATVGDFNSKLDDAHTYNQNHRGVQEDDDAPEHVLPCHADDDMQPAMQGIGQPDDHYDHAMFQGPPDAGAYAHGMRDLQDQPQYDEQGYEMQEPHSQGLQYQYQDQDASYQHQPTRYCDKQYGGPPMDHEVPQPFAVKKSWRAQAFAGFDRVAAEDHGFHDKGIHAPGRSNPLHHQNSGYTLPQQPKQPKSTKKSSRKKKKPPRSHPQAITTHNDACTLNEASCPTPAAPAYEHQADHQARFLPHQDQQHIHCQRQQAWETKYPSADEEQARQVASEQRPHRGVHFATVEDERQTLSAGLNSTLVQRTNVLPVSPPSTRAAVHDYPAQRQVDQPPASRHSAVSNTTTRQRFTSRSASQQPVAPRYALQSNALAVNESTSPSSDPVDLQNMSKDLAKASRDQMKKEAQARAENEALQKQLAREKEIAESQCYTLQREKQNMAAEVQKYQGHLADYRNLKKYVHSFGNDYDYLTRQATADMVKRDQLYTECSQRQDLQNALLQELQDGAEKATQLRTKAMEACREVRSQLSSTSAQCSHLQQELKTKDRLLTDEQNLRLQYQARLEAANHDNEDVIRQLETNHEAVLHKLGEVLSTLEESNSNRETTDCFEKITAAVQNLGSRPTATVEDVAAVKILVEGIAETIAQSSNNDGEAFELTAALKTCIEESFNGLKAELGSREELTIEASAYRETIAGLTEKLKMCNERAVEFKTRISESQARESEASEANATLKSKIVELEKAQIADAASIPNLHELELNMRAKASALDTLRTELDAKKQDLASLQATNVSLQEEIKDLQKQLAEVSTASTDFVAERAEWEKKIADAREETRIDMAKNIKKHYEQTTSVLKNENKRLSRQCDKHRDAEKTIRDLRSDLENTQRESLTTKGELQEKLTASNELARSHARKAETLQKTVTALQKSGSSGAGEAKKFEEVKTQLQEEQIEVARLGGQVKTLERQIGEEKSNASKATSETESVRRAVGIITAKAQGAQEQLAETRKKITEHETGMERFRASCAETLEDEQQAALKKEAALQDQLQQVRVELEERQQKDKAFHAQVEESWKKERINQETILASANDNILQAEVERDEARATAVSLQRQLEQMSTVSVEQEHSQTQTQMPAVSKAHGTIADAGPLEQGASEGQAPKQSKGSTPDAASNFMQPTKPRKRVDRNSQSTRETNAIPAPEILRPSNARLNTTEDKGATRGPVAEESQQGLICPSGMPTVDSSPSGHLNPLKSDRSGPTSKPPVLSKPQYQDVVPETQFDDAVPSFAAFHAGRSPVRRKAPRDDSAGSVYQNAPEFQNYEEANEPVYANTQDAPQYLQDELPMARDPYLFEKPMPPPNSSSKLVRNRSDVSQTSRGSQGLAPTSKKAGRRNSSQLKTPDPTRFRGGAGTSILSSSPGFVTTNKPARPTNTYHATPVNKRRTSRRQSDVVKEAAADTGAPSKRKSETSVVTGCEEERKKRVKPSSAAPTPARAGLHSMSHLAGAENSHASLMSELSIPHDSSRAGSQPSRMQTLSGQPTRGTRSTKKRTQHQQMNARFAQELNMDRR